MRQPTITAYLMRVDEHSGVVYKGYLAEVENTLEAEQLYVNYGRTDGVIAAICLNNHIACILNDNGKMLDLPVNRILLDARGVPCDFIVGDIMCVRYDQEGEFTSILESDIPYIESRLMAFRDMHEYKER
jgi:hypothetical protein